MLHTPLSVTIIYRYNIDIAPWNDIKKKPSKIKCLADTFLVDVDSRGLYWWFASWKNHLSELFGNEYEWFI